MTPDEQTALAMAEETVEVWKARALKAEADIKLATRFIAGEYRACRSMRFANDGSHIWYVMDSDDILRNSDADSLCDLTCSQAVARLRELAAGKGET